MDISDLFGGGGGGLLTPEQQGDVNQTTLQSIAAGLLKASAPSPYKARMTTLSGIGDALAGGIAARQAATTGALNQSLVRAKILEGLPKLLELQQKAQSAGIQLDPKLQRIIDAATTVSTGGIPQTPGFTGTQGGGTQGAGARTAQAGPGGILPPTTAEQKFADTHGFSRLDIYQNNPSFRTAFDKWWAETNPEIEAAQERKETMKREAEHYSKRFAAQQALGTTSLGIKELMEQGKALASRPDFHLMAGAGAETKAAMANFMATFGGPQWKNAAFTTQAFSKVFSEALLGRIEAMKENTADLPGGARQYLSTIQTMGKASPSMDLSQPTSQYLMDQISRESDRHARIADEAVKYVLGSPKGRLDPGWEAKERELMRGSKLFTPKELEDLAAGGNAPIPGVPQQPAAPAMPPPPPGAVTRETKPDGSVRYKDAKGNVIQQPAAIPRQAISPFSSFGAP